MIWACSGDDGAPGPQGPQGPQGPAGPEGPPGSSGGGVPASSADRFNIEVRSVTIPDGGGNPVVEFTLTNDLNQGLVGLPAGEIRFMLSQLSPAADGSGASSEWQAYTTRDTGEIPDGQATTETATDGTYVDNGDGTYQYTYANALADYRNPPVFDANKSHRLGIEIRSQAPNSSNGLYDFVPSAGGPVADMFTRDIVDNDTCNACHDRLEFHGGPRTDVGYCVTCHNPYSIDGDTGNTVDMKALIHNIHAGREGYVIIGYGGTEYDYSGVRWTQEPNNCTTCHQESDTNTPEASNWRLVANRASCGTCHYDDGDADSGNDFAIEDGVHPGGFNFADDTQCLDCHGEDATVTNPEGRLVSTEAIHATPALEEAEKFSYEIISVTGTAPGETPTATIRITNPLDNDSAYDINDPNGPFQVSGSRLRLDIAWTTTALGNIDPNDDLARAPDEGAPFAPIVIDFQTGATNDGSNTFSKAADVAIPTGISGSGIAVLEGRAAVEIDGESDRLPVSSETYTFAVTDSEAEERRKIVDIDQCNDCHLNLALHGDNRSGNTEVCSTCHNPHATDINRRVVGSDCEAVLGLDDAPIDMKRMIHGIHAGNIGVCGYNDSAHPYFDVVYPGHLNNCEGCHVKGQDTYYPVDATVVPATTVDAGADRSTLTDDVAISPNTSICSACHTSDLASTHMMQNGGDFAAGKDDTGALISSAVETCELCHGPGRTSDVKEKHGVGDFEFN